MLFSDGGSTSPTEVHASGQRCHLRLGSLTLFSIRWHYKNSKYCKNLTLHPTSARNSDWKRMMSYVKEFSTESPFEHSDDEEYEIDEED